MHQVFKQTLKKCLKTNKDTYLALLQIRSTPLRSGVPRHETLFFNHFIRGIIPVIKRASINANNDDDYCEALVERQENADTNNDTLRTGRCEAMEPS